MKATDWENAAKLIKERQSQAATADTSELSSFPSVSCQLMRADQLLCYRDHTCPYLQAHPFVCLKVISKQWIVHQMNPLSTDDSKHTANVIICFISSTRNQCKHSCIPTNAFF